MMPIDECPYNKSGGKEIKKVCHNKVSYLILNPKPVDLDEEKKTTGSGYSLIGLKGTLNTAKRHSRPELRKILKVLSVLQPNVTHFNNKTRSIVFVECSEKDNGYGNDISRFHCTAFKTRVLRTVDIRNSVGPKLVIEQDNPRWI